jgi:hypothetical protein
LNSINRDAWTQQWMHQTFTPLLNNELHNFASDQSLQHSNSNPNGFGFNINL